jgi:hypothetical protein
MLLENSNNTSLSIHMAARYLSLVIIFRFSQFVVLASLGTLANLSSSCHKKYEKSNFTSTSRAHPVLHIPLLDYPKTN